MPVFLVGKVSDKFLTWIVLWKNALSLSKYATLIFKKKNICHFSGLNDFLLCNLIDLN